MTESTFLRVCTPWLAEPAVPGLWVEGASARSLLGPGDAVCGSLTPARLP